MGAQLYWYMLESTSHFLNKYTISNESTHANVDFLYHYLARDRRFAQGIGDINNILMELQEKIDAAGATNVAIENREITTAYSPIAM